MGPVRRDQARPSPGRRQRAPTTVPVLPEVENRWSPRAFDDRPLPDRTLRALLEAARWAPSSYNEQPWRFILARKEDRVHFGRVLECLEPGNREWAARAPVLMLTVARTRFTKTGQPNRHAFHDVGLAMGNLLAQATAMGVAVHQMAGIDPASAREAFDVPEDYEIVAGVAIGYVGDPEQLDEDRRRQELAERSRKPLSELVFGSRWGEPAAVVERLG